MLIQDKGNHIAVVELSAGVGCFRIGLEGASDAYETIWNNQWEPSTVHQDAPLVYRARFGANGHSNQDISAEYWQEPLLFYIRKRACVNKAD